MVQITSNEFQEYFIVIKCYITFEYSSLNVIVKGALNKVIFPTCPLTYYTKF